MSIRVLKQEVDAVADASRQTDTIRNQYHTTVPRIFTQVNGVFCIAFIKPHILQSELSKVFLVMFCLLSIIRRRRVTSA